jgi:GNAT superfamily N-acetyltransferase
MPNSQPAFEIVPMSVRDAECVARLSGQLGYPVSAADAAVHLGQIRASGNEEVFVARAEGRAVGWIHVLTRHSISTGPLCEIGGIVVDSDYRGRKVGTRLMEAADEWARSHSLTGVRFTSRETRADAHRFYERLGFRVEKTSLIFAKTLAPA